MDNRHTFGNMAIVMFFFVQALDGICTYLSVRYTQSIEIEFNPLLRHLFHAWGVVPTLIWAKLLASVCAIILHLHHRHTAIIVVTLIYLIFAIIPGITLVYFSW